MLRIKTQETYNTKIVFIFYSTQYIVHYGRKERIYFEECWQALSQVWIRSVTMDDIARELGISKKTLYDFFRDKEELVDQSINYHMKNPIVDFNCYGDINAIDKFFLYREHGFKMLKLYNNKIDFDLKRLYPKINKKLQEGKKKKIYDQNLEILEQGIKEGLFRDGLNIDIISRLLVGRILLILNVDNGIFRDEEIRSEKIFDALMDYHLHAICTEKGLQYYKQKLNNVQNEK